MDTDNIQCPDDTTDEPVATVATEQVEVEMLDAVSLPVKADEAGLDGKDETMDVTSGGLEAGRVDKENDLTQVRFYD